METAEGDALAWIAQAALDTGIAIPDELALASYRKDKERMDAWVVLWGEYCKSTNREVITLLRRQLADGGDGWHLAQAANGLGQIGPAAAAGVPELTAALDSTVPHVRRYAARAIAMIGPAGKTALARIKVMAQNDANAQVREWAAEAAQTLEVAIAKE
jgi:HEAT repeat protein